MSMNGPDLTKMPPTLTAAIIIALIVLTAILEAIDSPNTLTLIAALVGVIGLQQARTSQATSRIEHQTNGVMERRHVTMQSAIDDIAITQKVQAKHLGEMCERLKRGDDRFDAMASFQEENRRLIKELHKQIEHAPLCVVQDGEGA